ncbi:MAG: hypothetical protein U0X91_16165 [Spirosomataceae bacterium]
MKNLLLYLFLFCFTMQQACIPSVFKKVKVTRTVTKPINLNYSINQVGNFQTYQLIDSRDITNLFDPENNRVSSATIEKMDIHGASIGAKVLPANTATQVILSADVISGALLDKVNPLLNKTKTISISNGGGLDLENAIGNAIGTTEDVALHNAISILNATGAVELQKILKENLSGINRGGLSIRLNGTVPNGRLVMSLTIQIAASITYTRCESILVSDMRNVDDECI